MQESLCVWEKSWAITKVDLTKLARQSFVQYLINNHFKLLIQHFFSKSSQRFTSQNTDGHCTMKIFHKTPSNFSSVGVGSLAAYNSSSSVVCAYKIYMFMYFSLCITLIFILQLFLSIWKTKSSFCMFLNFLFIICILSVWKII